MLSPSFETKLAARGHFTPNAPLLKHHLLRLFDDPLHHQPPLLSQYLKVDERVVNYLLDLDELDTRLLLYARHVAPQASLQDLLLSDDVKRRLESLVREHEADGNGLIFYFQGA